MAPAWLSHELAAMITSKDRGSICACWLHYGPKVAMGAKLVAMAMPMNANRQDSRAMMQTML
eukprot:73024-Amphidinium_carterae.1